MSLEEYRYKVSSLTKSNNPGTSNILIKYKKYVITAIIILVLLILFKPKFIQSKIIPQEEGGKIQYNGKINFFALFRYWIIISLVLCIGIYVYCNIICKKNSSSSTCKKCSS